MSAFQSSRGSGQRQQARLAEQARPLYVPGVAKMPRN